MPEKYGPKSTVHGTFRKWVKEGIFDQILSICVKEYRKSTPDNIWYAFDTSSKKGPLLLEGGKNPTDRGKQGIKQIILVDRKGAPIAVGVGPANAHDSTLFIPTLKSFPAEEKVQIITADAAFDSKKLRNFCASKNIALIAATNPRKSKKKHKTRPLHRWIVERTFGWFSWYRGLKICWAKLLSSHLAFLQLASAHRLFSML